MGNQSYWNGKSQATVLALKNCLREEQLMPLWSTFILLNQLPQSLFYQLDLLLFVSLCWDEPKTWLIFMAVQGVNNKLSKEKNEEEVLVSLPCCISFRDVSESINFYWNLDIWKELKCIFMDYSSWKFTLRKKKKLLITNTVSSHSIIYFNSIVTALP